MKTDKNELSAEFSENSCFHFGNYYFLWSLGRNRASHSKCANERAANKNIAFHARINTSNTDVRWVFVCTSRICMHVRCLRCAISFVRKKPWRGIRVCIIKIYICAAIIIMARIILWGVCLKPLHQLIFLPHVQHIKLFFLSIPFPMAFSPFHFAIAVQRSHLLFLVSTLLPHLYFSSLFTVRTFNDFRYIWLGAEHNVGSYTIQILLLQAVHRWFVSFCLFLFLFYFVLFCFILFYMYISKYVCGVLRGRSYAMYAWLQNSWWKSAFQQKEMEWTASSYIHVVFVFVPCGAERQ